MCLAYPGKIIKIENDEATVDYISETRKAKLVTNNYKVGDYVIVQAQIVVQKISEKKAIESIAIYTQN